MKDRSIQLRAQEIIATSPVQISVKDALKRALLEHYPNPDDMAEAAASALAASLSGLRKRTYELPEEATEQLSLFDIPQVIGISTPEGDLLIPGSQAKLGHVRQWQKEGQQHHATQLLRFKRAGADLETVKDVDDEAMWGDARAALAERKQHALERGQ